jgi:DNA helicase-2/ATP-dependent DNA helicase PcrA
VKTILDYLRVINQPDNNDALARIINTPSRRIGEATIKSLLEEADKARITLWSLILGVVQGNRNTKTKLPSQTDQGLSRFVNIILTARNKMSGSNKELKSIPDLIKFVVNKTDYESWLEDHHGDVHKARWANVEELITQASDFQNAAYEDDALPQIDDLEQTEDDDWLPRFLANVALASEVKTDDTDSTPKAQVTISTIHAAKGLEWPVVFIPATYEGSIPHSRSDDTNEERRIFYVAMTRAKALLYMSYPLKNSRSEETTLSPFLIPGALSPLLNQQGPSLRESSVQTMSLILRRALPSKESISKSSMLLRSSEDDLFPLEGEEEVLESRWNGKTGNPTFTMGQQAPKRRRVELGKSPSNLEEGFAKPWQPSYATTMERAASFTIAGAGFVSAGSHMQVLKEHAVDSVADAAASTEDDLPKKKAAKQKSKLPEGQGTLFGFLGKAEPEPPKTSATRARELDCRKRDSESLKAFIPARNINEARKPQANGEVMGIAPALASHRLGATSYTKPHSKASSEQHHRNDYVFLSSSPPRVKTNREPIVEKPPGLTAKPPLMPLLRPALSMHTTTMSALQNSNATGKTYGLKRSMDGWKNKGGKAFKPPTMRRPQ